MKRITLALFLCLVFTGVSGQILEGDLPHPTKYLGRWSELILDTNFDGIYLIAGDSTWVVIDVDSLNARAIAADSVDATRITADSLDVRAIDADSIHVDSLVFENGATFTNEETDTAFIIEEVVKIEGDFVVTGHVAEGEHPSGGSWISTPGTQTIGTGGTFERLNEGNIAYTGFHLHEFTQSDGRLTYTSARTISVTIQCVLSVESGEVTQEIDFRLAKGGSTVAGTNTEVTFTAVNNNASVGLLWMDDMAQNEYWEVWGTSDANGDEFDINSMTFIITKH